MPFCAILDKKKIEKKKNINIKRYSARFLFKLLENLNYIKQKGNKVFIFKDHDILILFKESQL